jgi:CelD/BcsL family acetyltransferase involved in cellulose biosynthesis
MAGTLLPGRDWSMAIERQAQESLYCSKAWLDLLTGLYGYSLIPLTATDVSGRVTGFLPLCSIHSPLRGRRLVALPFSDQCPLLATDPASADRLVNEAILLAQRQRARYLELRTGVSATLSQRSDLIRSDLYVRWLASLSPDPAEPWSALRKSVQQKVGRARRLGVQVRVATRREEMALYYHLHLRTRTKKHGMPTQPARFFLMLWDAFAASGALQLLLAESQGQVIAGAILLASGATVRFAYSASHEDYLHLAPNNLLVWEAITWGCAHGYTTLDLGRTARDNHGLMEFKRGWGATEEPLTYYYYPHEAGLAATSERSWKYHALTGCWKRLPLSIAAVLGDHLYKQLG